MSKTKHRKKIVDHASFCRALKAHGIEVERRKSHLAVVIGSKTITFSSTASRTAVLNNVAAIRRAGLDLMKAPKVAPKPKRKPVTLSEARRLALEVSADKGKAIKEEWIEKRREKVSSVAARERGRREMSVPMRLLNEYAAAFEMDVDDLLLRALDSYAARRNPRTYRNGGEVAS